MAHSASIAQRPHPQKRRWSKQQLLRYLEGIGDLATPLAPTLPPSPPASRASSPAPGSKRKPDPSLAQEPSKRPRTSSVSSRSYPQPPRAANSTQPPAAHRSSNPLPPVDPAARSEPCEDGEVREDLPLPPPPPPSSTEAVNVVSSFMPVRRPKRGRPYTRHFDQLHDKYHNAGRQLKYSGDARFWSTYPSSHREYRPLPNPPPLNSPYHKYGGLIARLELVDALICFTYSLWNKDYNKRSCIVDSWTTITAFLSWCKQKWQTEEASNDGEKALLGLIFMIEGFINARKVAYSPRLLDIELAQAVDVARKEVESAINQAESIPKGANPSLLGVNTQKQATPQMLPSPASIAPANSANSTPTNRDDGTPNPNGRSSSIASSAAPPPAPVVVAPAPHPRIIPSRYHNGQTPAHVATAANSVTVPMGTHLIGSLKDHFSNISTAVASLKMAEQTLTLPIIARHFPKTFARMACSTLSFMDEHEPDIEDDEGELYWPGQGLSGEGLGWVCLMGQAMLREFGRPYGYKGLAGVVPKPRPEDPIEGGNKAGKAGSRPGSTPHGHTPSMSR
ncbi:hypothetical protein DFS33DRAFT_1269501 [Desarmillaria ectypa]|nr:hypothetical protein DFS33DRAFT_1269501 [Desarmillaria ectypa]